ncbi:MAG: hypothetical protein IPO08_19675 [Xanthomonadales bacterium]|nr:hypothetical protein [Xanthomonadales bacterium]
MDAGSIALGVAIGLAIGTLALHISRRLERKLITSQRELIVAQSDFARDLSRRFMALKRNAFLTNEHGHRVRYHKASAEVRARAEAE